MTTLRGDRRSLKSQQALMDALLACLAEKPYDQITVRDILDRANVGRSTFYTHFQTKDDLLRAGFERVLNLLSDQIDTGADDHSLRMDTTRVFAHARGHYDLYRTLIWGSGYEILTRDAHTLLKDKFMQKLGGLAAGQSKSPIPLDVMCYSMAGSLLILLKWWLDQKMPYTPEQMDEMFQQLTMTKIRELLVMN
jgi:AcrR family transcriptional regulator